ncbi:MAG: HAMP domain-containing histidine kinase [Ruminococcus sp.]|nr:HAMP domain-containing histidine kinase [Ruminococcus sp.]
MIKILKNTELSLSLKLMLLITVLGSVYGFRRDRITGAIFLGSGLIMIVIHFICNAYRLSRLEAMSIDIGRILHGDENVNFNAYTEGETAILECELSKMTIMLREQQQKLKNDKVYLADSLADISHQLRTPLTSLNLVNSLLSRPDCTEEKRRELIMEMRGLLGRIDWLITALLNISKLDAGTVKFRQETISMRDFLSKATMPIQIPMELREQQLVIEAEGDFSGDIHWTGEAVGNIIKNCMEHTPDGGRITVVGKANALYTEIIITDTGCGISREDLPHIFERFYKGKDSSDSSYGIGLALARKIVNSQNGTLKAFDPPEGGAGFEMRFYKGTV